MLLTKLRLWFPLPRKALPIVILGFVVRLGLAPFTGHPFDMNNIYTDSRIILQGGVPTSDVANIPMFYYILVPISYIYNAVSNFFGIYPTPFSSLPSALKSIASWTIPNGAPVHYVTDWAFNLILKIPFIVSDFVGGTVLYILVYRKYGERSGIVTFTLWFLNPMLIWVSSVWGMWDSLAATFMLLSTLLLLRNNLGLSALCLAIATGFKDYPAILAIPMLIYASRIGKVRRLVLPIGIFVTATLVIFSPFLSQAFYHNLGILNPIGGNPAQDPSLTYGLTYWSVAPLTAISSALVTSVSLLSLAILGLIFSALAVLRLRPNQESLFFWEFAFISVIFFSFPRINEQWFVWLLPYMILLAKTRNQRSLVLGISILALIYSLVNTMFVSFFIPMYPYLQEGLVNTAKSVMFLSYYRLYAMATLGIVFSMLLAVSLANAYRTVTIGAERERSLSAIRK